jgi:hypothetical protein
MDRTQQHRKTLKFIEELELDHHSATLVDLIANHKSARAPLDDLRKASFYLLRLIEMYEQDEEADVDTDPRAEGIGKNGTKVLRLYEKLI